jgi:hypothetical protein
MIHIVTLQSLAGCISNRKNPSHGDIDDKVVDLTAGIDIFFDSATVKVVMVLTLIYRLFLYM